jgi:hypothetical protein
VPDGPGDLKCAMREPIGEPSCFSELHGWDNFETARRPPRKARRAACGVRRPGAFIKQCGRRENISACRPDADNSLDTEAPAGAVVWEASRC